MTNPKAQELVERISVRCGLEAAPLTEGTGREILAVLRALAGEKKP